MSILEKLFQAETKNHADLLKEYRQLLISDVAEDAGKLIEVAEALRIPLDRLQGDQAAAQEAERLSVAVGDLGESEAALQAAHDASSKHAESMRKKIDSLKQKQAELDNVLRLASNRATRVVTSKKRLDELHASHADLFGDVAVEAVETERSRLQALADTLPSLHEELRQAQADRAESEEAYEGLATKSWNVSPLDEKKADAIKAKEAAAKHRDEIAVRIGELHTEIDNAENARRKLVE